MIKRKEGHFTGEQDTLLYYQRWLADGPARATLIVTHGMAEHSDAYARLVNGLQLPGLEVYGWDLPGHGHSEGRWGVVRSFDDFSKNLRRFINMVHQQRGHDGPLILLGHSMGGLITVDALLGALEHPFQCAIAGVVLSSPLFEVALRVPPLKDKMARMLASYLPNFTLSNELSFEDLTRDRAVVKEYEKDTLRHDRISLNFYVSLTDMMMKTKTRAEKLTLPLFMQVAGNDKVVSARAAQLFFDKYGAEDKQLTVYDEFYHEIYNDLGRERVFQDLANWLKPRMK